MNVRDMWKAKLEGRSVPSAGAVPLSLTRSAFVGRVLGIDPSLRGTGLALIEFSQGGQPVLLRCATVKVPARHPMAFALGEIHRSVLGFLDGTDVRHVALEQTIFVQNFQTAQILGAARGAAMAVAALHTLPVFEYAPLRVKQAVVGAGRAS
jgi:crossover junction endodeoxyribonuclease RuvC